MLYANLGEGRTSAGEKKCKVLPGSVSRRFAQQS